MKPVRYVILNPTGNLTALVTEWGGPEDEAEITRRLMEESEQTAYLEPPALPGALARIRLMGGEFCGNAAMAAAGWLLRGRLQTGETLTVPIEVSGTREIVFCRIRGEGDGFEGTVEMPPVRSIREETVRGIPMTKVEMEGITHRIREGRVFPDRREAETLLRQIAGETADEAAGLIDWNPETGEMRPLVYVRGSHTMVWETACGSGSAAVGAAEAWRRGNGTVETAVHQPGGTIRAEAAAENGEILSVSITGFVRFGEEKILRFGREAAGTGKT